MIDFKQVRKDNNVIISSIDFEVNDSLPLLELTEIRNSDEILNRINILHIFYAIYLEGKESANFFLNEILKNNWENYLTEREKHLLKNGSISNLDIIEFSWYKEDIYILLWCFDKVKRNEPYLNLNEIDLSEYYAKIPPEKKYDEYMKYKLLLSVDIFKMLDFYYCLSWSAKKKIRQNNLFNFLKRNKANELSIILERRKALEWLCDKNLNWDEINLDT